MPLREIEIAGSVPPTLDHERDLLRRDFDDAYSMDTSGRVTFNSLGGRNEAFMVSREPSRVRIRVDNIERDYGAAAAVAESLGRRTKSRALDTTTHELLWPLVGGGMPVSCHQLCWWADAELVHRYSEVAARSKPEALPISFSTREPFTCEAAGDISAFLELAAAQVSAGGAVAWLSEPPLLVGTARWPQVATGVAMIEVYVESAALDESWRQFFREVAARSKARLAVARPGRSIARRLGTWFPSGAADFVLPDTVWRSFSNVPATWVWSPKNESIVTRGGSTIADSEGVLVVGDLDGDVLVTHRDTHHRRGRARPPT